MPIAHVRGIDLHYRVSGSGSETLVMINGIGDDLEAWLLQVPDFVAAGLQVVTFDNRGVGRSSKPVGPYTSRQMADDTKGLVDAIGLTSMHLMGVSMGGVIAQEYVLAYPEGVRSVVLANTYAAADKYALSVFASWCDIASSAGMKVAMRAIAPWIFSADFYERQGELLDRWVAAMQATTQPTEAFMAQLAALLSHDARDRLADIVAPVLVLVAESDSIVRPELSLLMYDALPNAAWAVVPGGHSVMWENPAPWNRAIRDFVSAHSPTPV